MSRSREVLGLPGARRLLFSSILGRLPIAGSSSLAILLLVHDRTGSFGVAGVAVGLHGAASATLSPVQGALADRIGQRRVLWPAALVRAAVLVGLVVAARAGAHAAALVVLSALAGAVVPPITACARALWREVAPDPVVREAAYGLEATLQEVILIAGPLLISLAVAAASPDVAVLMLAGLTVAGTALFASFPLLRRRSGPQHPRRRGGALASPGLRALVVTIVATGLGWGAVTVAVPALAVDLGSRDSAGVLFALVGVGSMAGGIVYTTRAWRRPIGARYPLVLLALAVGTAPLAGAQSLAVALPLSVVAGLAWAPTLSSQYTLVGRVALPGTAIEAFTWNQAAWAGGVAGGAALAGTVADAAGIPAALAVGCLAFALASCAALLGRGAVERSAAAVEPSPG